MSAKLGPIEVNFESRTHCEITYVFTFVVEDEKRLINIIANNSWKREDQVFDPDQSFRISRYFNQEVSKLYLHDTKCFRQHKYTQITIANEECIPANVLSCQLLLFPSSVGQLMLSVSVDWHDGNVSSLCSLHEKLRAWSNSYSENGTLHGASALRFVRNDPKEYDEFDPDLFDPLPAEDRCALLSFLLGLNALDHRKADPVVVPICDRRSPALLFVSCNDESVPDVNFVYKLVAGDGAQAPLPSDEYIANYLHQREASPYYGVYVPSHISSRSIVDGYGFLFIGSKDNTFFNKVVRDSTKSIYLVLFSLLWHQ